MEETKRNLREKYRTALQLLRDHSLEGVDTQELDGQLIVTATVSTPYEKDVFWNEIKAIGGERPGDLAADIRVENPNYYHTHRVETGDTLGRIANRYYGDPTLYGRIFDTNQGIITDPDRITPGTALNIPNPDPPTS